MTLGWQRNENAFSKLHRLRGRSETPPTFRRHPSTRLHPEAPLPLHNERICHSSPRRLEPPLPPLDERICLSSPRRPQRVAPVQAEPLSLRLRRP